jgi:hypothetical protein
VLGHPAVPLLEQMPAIARRDAELGAVFALLDAVRGGRSREVSFATQMIFERLKLPVPYTGA